MVADPVSRASALDNLTPKPTALKRVVVRLAPKNGPPTCALVAGRETHVDVLLDQQRKFSKQHLNGDILRAQ